MGGIANGIAYHGGFLPVRGHVPDLQRLHARLGAPRGAHRAARDLRLDPRLHRPGRGRPDPPAGRALRRAARDAQPDVRPARRPERGGRRVAARRGAAPRPGGARPHPPEAAGAARAPRPAPRTGVDRGGYVLAEAVDSEGHPPTPDVILIATGSELSLAMEARAELDRRGHPDACRVAALLGALRGAARGVSRRGPAAGRDAPGEHRGRRLAGLGPLGRPRGRHHRHRPVRCLGAREPSCSRRSASPPRTSPRWPAGDDRRALGCRLGPLRTRRARRRHHVPEVQR